MMRFQFDYQQEIPQTENTNATSRLWIQPNQTVYKHYVIRNELTSQNITNLLLITKNKKLRKLAEIVQPIDIVRDSDIILGYTMPYIRGKTLDKWLSNKEISNNRKLDVLIKLAKTISRMPKGICIGDLHTNNVLVDEIDSIHIIDIDGFSLKKGYQISCPAEYWLTDTVWFQNRKYWRKGKFFVSKNTDIICWYMMFIKWIMGGSPLMYTKEEVFRYFSYLKNTDFPISILNDIFRLSSKRQNIVDIAHINELRDKEISLYSYQQYRKWS